MSCAQTGVVALLAIALAADPATGQADTIPVPAAITAAYEARTRSESGAPGPEYWQIRPRYELTGRLDPDSATFAGIGSIRLVNASDEFLTEVVLRLDQNRFRDAGPGEAGTRGMDLRSLTVNGRLVALADSRVSGLTTTVVRVHLTDPVAPSDSLLLSMAWDYEIPDGEGLRQGRWGDSLFQMGQWYPRLAMYDDLAGWDTSRHDGSMEFYNPYASFDVMLTVPVGWLVGATGALENPTEVFTPGVLDRLQSASESDTTELIVSTELTNLPTQASASGFLEWRFRADSVSDFAWATSRDYSWAARGVTLAGERIVIHAFATDVHREAIFGSMQVVADALTVLSDRLTPYPWPQLTLVDGPEGGMEYPSLTMSHGDREPHESSHQWFPMLVGSDETRFNFLDEGLASFLPSLVAGSPLGRVDPERATLAPLLLPDDIRTVRPVLGYGRGSRLLRVLAARFGDDAVVFALRTYVQEWRFRHPSPWDFMATMERSLGEELDEIWLGWLFSAEAVR